MLRREFRIGAYEAEDEIFGWEREMLLRLYTETLRGRSPEGMSSGDLQTVPEELKGL